MTVELKDLSGLLIINTSVANLEEFKCLLKTITAKFYELEPELNHVVVYF